MASRKTAAARRSIETLAAARRGVASNPRAPRRKCGKASDTTVPIDSDLQAVELLMENHSPSSNQDDEIRAEKDHWVDNWVREENTRHLNSKKGMYLILSVRNCSLNVINISQ